MSAAQHAWSALHVAPVSSKDASDVIRRIHYSHTVVQNSQLHLGVYWDGRLEGAMQFGPSLDKRKTIAMVRDTPWNGFLELNRMAFSERLPANSESRALGVALRMIRKHYPHVQWIISFADGAQCGDGTIYRAAGFLLTGIKRNTTLWRGPSGEVFADLSMRGAGGSYGHAHAAAQAVVSRVTKTKGKNATTGGASMKQYREAGFAPIAGFQLRYLFPLAPDVRERLAVPVLPYSAIADAGAGMYLGKARAKQAMEGSQPSQRRRDTDPHAPKSKARA